MHTKHAFHWWKPVIAFFGILPILAVIITEWSYRNVGRGFVGLVILGGVASLVALVIGGIVLLCRREFRWGLIALLIALFTFFVYFRLIPAGYR